MIILAVDSGLEKNGYAFIDKNKTHTNGFKLETSGLIKTEKNECKELRLKKIYHEFAKLIKKYKPQTLIIEQLFFFKNLKTAIAVAQAQGVLLLLAGQNNIPVHTLTPLQIKQTITGYGQADKKSVQKMLDLTLNIKSKISYDDVSDAIACGVAYCYLNR